MKVLNLTLKKKWFDMIISGEKKEEYRAIKPYWEKRFDDSFTHIQFTNGYGKHRPSFIIEIKRYCSGFGIVEWGAPEDKSVYIFELGEIIANTQQEVTDNKGE